MKTHVERSRDAGSLVALARFRCKLSIEAKAVNAMFRSLGLWKAVAARKSWGMACN